MMQYSKTPSQHTAETKTWGELMDDCILSDETTIFIENMISFCFKTFCLLATVLFPFLILHYGL